MNPPCVPLRILMSRDAATKLQARVHEVLGGRAHQLLAPGNPDARSANVAFISRDITGLSTKHQVLPQTRQVYDTLLSAPRLEWVHIHSAGADRPVFGQLQGRGVCISTSAGANAKVVAQTALLGVLTLARHWPRLLAAQRERRWAPLIASGLPRELQGQTAVVVGWGPVGRETGRLLEALGLRLIVVRRSAPQGQLDAHTVPPWQLHAVLPRADWLVLACALTQETRGMLGAKELALLPRHAALVNVARGELVDEPALVEALACGRLGGAFLDVFAHEPLPAQSPLWDLPNVIVTPHSAGFSDGHEARVAQIFLDNLSRWTRGQALLNQAPAPAR